MNLVKVFSRAKIPAAIMIALVLVLAVTGGALAARGVLSSDDIPNNGTIYACYVPHKNVNERQGKLRVVTNADMCKKSETYISWNVGGGFAEGKGDTGPRGPAGTSGPTGAGVTPPSFVVLKGPVTGLTMKTTGTVSEILFQVVLKTGAAAVDLTPGTTRVKYVDPSQSIISTTMDRFESNLVQGVTGSPTDSDLFLEPGEIFEIRLLDLDFFLEPDLGGNTVFTIDVISEFGSVLTFEATTPISLPEESAIDLPVS